MGVLSEKDINKVLIGIVKKKSSDLDYLGFVRKMISAGANKHLTVYSRSAEAIFMRESIDDEQLNFFDTSNSIEFAKLFHSMDVYTEPNLFLHQVMCYIIKMLGVHRHDYGKRINYIDKEKFIICARTAHSIHGGNERSKKLLKFVLNFFDKCGVSYRSIEHNHERDLFEDYYEFDWKLPDRKKLTSILRSYDSYNLKLEIEKYWFIKAKIKN